MLFHLLTHIDSVLFLIFPRISKYIREPGDSDFDDSDSDYLNSIENKLFSKVLGKFRKLNRDIHQEDGKYCSTQQSTKSISDLLRWGKIQQQLRMMNL